MLSNEFEKAYSDFLENAECDKAFSAINSAVRVSFLAGWMAAGGDTEKAQQIISDAVPVPPNLAGIVDDTEESPGQK